MFYCKWVLFPQLKTLANCADQATKWVSLRELVDASIYADESDEALLAIVEPEKLLAKDVQDVVVQVLECRHVAGVGEAKDWRSLGLGVLRSKRFIQRRNE